MKMIALLFALQSVTLAAQTSTSRIAWDMGEAPALAQSFAYTFKLDAAAPITLTATCAAKTPGSSCTAPIANLTSGSHTIVVTATSPLASASSDPLTGTAPGKPLNVTITITVTVP